MSPLKAELFIGLMSGTSMDGIDAAIIDFASKSPKLIASYQHAMPQALHSTITPLLLPGNDNIDAFGSADHQLGKCFADAVAGLLKQATLKPDEIIAIGSHGQTVRHRPPSKNTQHPFTLQIGDPNIIAAQTGITTVSDFRRKDIALGGQGAPLVPAFHHYAFHCKEHNRAIVNIGGISNVTLLPAQGNVTGFDTGPGNRLLDAWMHRHHDKAFDENGAWANAHPHNRDLLSTLKNHAFFQRSPPKSTGREEFNLEWLDQQLQKHPSVAPGVVQATLLRLSAETIADAINAQTYTADEIFICGGGALNKALMAMLNTLLPGQVTSTAVLGIPPEWVEAAAFAWLARQTINNLAGNLPAVTGAKKPSILGGIYPP